jgi:hypothetical protein
MVVMDQAPAADDEGKGPMLTTRHNGSGWKAWRLRLAVSCFLVTSVLVPHNGAEAQATGSADRLDPAFQRALFAFYRVWLGRSLTNEEGIVVVREQIAFQRKEGRDAAGVREATTSFATGTAQLREHEGKPIGLRLRHDSLAYNFFRPEMQNTAELKLWNEPDPVRFFDTATRRIMTERDVVALANLIVFAGSDEEPRHRNLSFQEAETFVRERLCDISRSGVSAFFSEAGILWAGIRQQWAHFTAEEKRKARFYVQRGRGNIMSVNQTAKVLGIDRWAALDRTTKGMADTFIGAGETHLKQSDVLRVMKNN